MIEFYRRYFLVVGFVISAVVAVAIAITDVWVRPDFVDSVISGNRATVYATTASIGASLLGFVLTAVSVIIVFAELPRFQLLRKSGQLSNIFGVFFQAVVWLAALTLISLAAVFIDREASRHASISYLITFLMTLCVFRSVSCARILWMMTTIAVSPIHDSASQRNAA